MIERNLYGKYEVRDHRSARVDGDFFVLRLGDPHADKAAESDPTLALELNERYRVWRAHAPFGEWPLLGCVALPITTPWARDGEPSRVSAMLRVYASSVASESPDFAAELLAIVENVAPEVSIDDRVAAEDARDRAALARLHELRAQRLREKDRR